MFFWIGVLQCLHFEPGVSDFLSSLPAPPLIALAGADVAFAVVGVSSTFAPVVGAGEDECDDGCDAVRLSFIFGFSFFLWLFVTSLVSVVSFVSLSLLSLSAVEDGAVDVEGAVAELVGRGTDEGGAGFPFVVVGGLSVIVPNVNDRVSFFNAGAFC